MLLLTGVPSRADDARAAQARATPSASGAERVVARVGDATITLGELDRRCDGACARLAAAVRATEHAALDALVDALLLARAPAPRPTVAPVTDADVDGYLAAHAAEFHGPAVRDRAAVRFYLERERRRALEAQLVAAARRRVPPELYPERLAAAAGAPGDVLARVGATAVTRRDVEAHAALALYRARGELARERRRQLDALIAEQLWAAAAAARGIPVAQLEAQVAARAPAVTDADVARYADEQRRAGHPEVAQHPERVRPYLEFRARHAASDAFLVAERRKMGVTILLREPTPPRLALAPGIGGERGGKRATVHVLLLTGYRGTASRATWAAVRDLPDEPGVALAVRPLLPQWDPEATLAAVAVRCAGAQSHDRFWALQDAVAGAPELPDRAALRALAHDVGLDPAAFDGCLADASVQAAVAADSAAAERLGLERPPVVLVDGLVLGTAPSRERIAAAIRAARAPHATPAAAPLSAPSSSASASR